MGNLTVDHEFPARLAKPLFEPKRFKVIWGGRSSSKSTSVSRMLVIKAHTSKIRILCTRELQNSLKDSVWKLLSDTIHAFNLSDFFVINKDGIHGANGSEFIFAGLKNDPKKIKSTEAIDFCWLEEAESITEESWDLLIPTIRKDGSEIIVVFNPADELDETYQRFITPFLSQLNANNGIYQDDTYTIIKMNYSDNPFLPEESRLDMERMKKNDYKKYLHVYSGECLSNYADSIIDPLWIRASVDAHTKLGFKAKGIKSLGLDLADTGNDNKAYVIRHGSVVTHCKGWYEGDVVDCMDRAFEAADENRVSDVVYDKVGIGAAVKPYLTSLQGRDKFIVTGFLGNDAVDDPTLLYMNDRSNGDVFKNRRAQAFWLLRDRFEATYRAIEKGDYTDPDEMISLDSNMDDLKQLMSELARIQRKRGNNSMIQIESKDDMKKRGMKSPGLADSLMYAFSNPPIKSSWDKPIQYSSNFNNI